MNKVFQVVGPTLPILQRASIVLISLIGRFFAFCGRRNQALVLSVTQEIYTLVLSVSQKTYALTFQHRMWTKSLVGNRFGDFEGSIKIIYINFYKDRGCRDSINAWTKAVVDKTIHPTLKEKKSLTTRNGCQVIVAEVFFLIMFLRLLEFMVLPTTFLTTTTTFSTCSD